MARAWEYYRAIMATYIARGKSVERLPVEAALALLEGKSVPLTQPLLGLRDSLMRDPILVFTWKSSYPYGTAERGPFLDAAETYFDTRDERLATRLRSLSQGADADLAAPGPHRPRHRPRRCAQCGAQLRLRGSGSPAGLVGGNASERRYRGA